MYKEDTEALFIFCFDFSNQSSFDKILCLYNYYTNNKLKPKNFIFIGLNLNSKLEVNPDFIQKFCNEESTNFIMIQELSSLFTQYEKLILLFQFLNQSYI